VRHVRMLTLFALGAALAMALVGPASAVANKEATEKAEFQAFANCPFHEIVEEHPLNACTWAQSSYKERWESKTQKEAYEAEHGPTPGLLSHFTAGNISVALKLPITLRGGVTEKEIEPTELVFSGAEGAPTIQPVAQAGPPLTKSVDKADLSGSELDRFNYYVKVAKETKTTATVELAGSARNIHLNLANLLDGEGTAFSFPVKVKLGSGFVGSNCYVGSDENPIVVNFTTGTSGELQGKLGQLTFGEMGILTTWGNTLVASGFASPGAEGCGVEGGADEAINAALGLPSSNNSSVLNGVLKLAGAENVEEHLGV
jgi:hypothetical protein